MDYHFSTDYQIPILGNPSEGTRLPQDPVRYVPVTSFVYTARNVCIYMGKRE